MEPAAISVHPRYKCMSSKYVPEWSPISSVWGAGCSEATIRSGVSTQQFDSFTSARCRCAHLPNFDTNNLSTFKWRQVSMSSHKSYWVGIRISQNQWHITGTSRLYKWHNASSRIVHLLALNAVMRQGKAIDFIRVYALIISCCNGEKLF